MSPVGLKKKEPHLGWLPSSPLPDICPLSGHKVSQGSWQGSSPCRRTTRTLIDTKEGQINFMSAETATMKDGRRNQVPEPPFNELPFVRCCLKAPFITLFGQKSAVSGIYHHAGPNFGPSLLVYTNTIRDFSPPFQNTTRALCRAWADLAPTWRRPGHHPTVMASSRILGDAPSAQIVSLRFSCFLINHWNYVRRKTHTAISSKRLASAATILVSRPFGFHPSS
ncbi:hypothetical protein BGZ60DRAFT_516060 [Tricladium varicosporioides]|nr:hypothetical protein BGZ60DRAFT_516060 [Hymenoscyphus varicosporioides]